MQLMMLTVLKSPFKIVLNAYFRELTYVAGFVPGNRLGLYLLCRINPYFGGI